MRLILKRVAHWTVPPGIQELGLAYIRGSRKLDPSVQAVLDRNKIFRNRHAGERCFILATGPSIEKQDLTLLEGELCISMSNFFVHPEFHRIRPRYHCIAPLHSPFTDEDGIRWFRQIEPYMEHTAVFLSYSDKRLIDEHRLFLGRDVRYLGFGDDWSNPANKHFDLARRLGGPQSVSIMALMLALYVGCRAVYLLGTDHTSFNPSTGEYDYRHFYVDRDANALGELPPPPDREVQFSAGVRLWRQYKVLREYAGARGVAIYNATGGGILNLFPRVIYEELFHEGRSDKDTPLLRSMPETGDDQV